MNTFDKIMILPSLIIILPFLILGFLVGHVWQGVSKGFDLAEEQNLRISEAPWYGGSSEKETRR